MFFIFKMKDIQYKWDIRLDFNINITILHIYKTQILLRLEQITVPWYILWKIVRVNIFLVLSKSLVTQKVMRAKFVLIRLSLVGCKQVGNNSGRNTSSLGS